MTRKLILISKGEVLILRENFLQHLIYRCTMRINPFTMRIYQ